MNTTFELNNQRLDSALCDKEMSKASPIVEVFSAMVQNKELNKFNKATNDACVARIKELASNAEKGDSTSAAELNTIRKFAIEQPLMQEMKLLNIFGSYQALGFDESIERDIYTTKGEMARMQAANGDVPFPVTVKTKYPVGSVTVSGGYAVDYRRLQLGDMTKENEGMQRVQTTIRNIANAYVIDTVYNAIKNAEGVKFNFEGAGLTKAGVDAVIRDVVRLGKPNIVGDYALLQQFNGFVGFSDNVRNIYGISQKVLDEINDNGIMGSYNGSVLAVMDNPYDFNKLNSDGTNFETMLPAGIGFIIPTGINSPIATWTRGGLTSLTGNDIQTGQVMTRFDLEFAVDVAKGQEYAIGLIRDTNLSPL